MPREKLICSFVLISPFLCMPRKWIVLSSSWSLQAQRGGRGDVPLLSQSARGALCAKNRNMKFCVRGATSGHNITEATCAVHSQTLAEFNAFQRAAWFQGPGIWEGRGKQKHCLLLQRQGVWDCVSSLTSSSSFATETNSEGQQSARGWSLWKSSEEA